MLNVALVNPKQYGNKTFYINLGLATIGAIARNHGHSVSVIDFDELKYREVEFSSASYRGSGRLEDVDVLLVSGMITNLKNILYAINEIKKYHPNVMVVLGGGAASVATPTVMDELSGSINFFVINEGDEVILPLLSFIEINQKRFGNNIDAWPDIPLQNVKAIQRGRLVGSVKRDFPDISKVPMPCYDLFDTTSYAEYLRRTGRAWELYSSKGCPMGCTFCYKISGSKVRYRDVDNVMAEMDHIHGEYGIAKFSFEDDTFGLNKEWLTEFCNHMKQRPYGFRIQAFVNSMRNMDHVVMMKEAGLYGVSMGIESGSEEILKDMMKNNKLGTAQKIIKFCNEHDIYVSGTFILGMPEETWDTVEDTKLFLCENYLNDYQVFFLNPYPGTKLYQDLMDAGRVVDGLKNLIDFKLQNEIHINLTRFSNEELFSMREYVLDSVANHWKRDKMNPATWERVL